MKNFHPDGSQKTDSFLFSLLLSSFIIICFTGTAFSAYTLSGYVYSAASVPENSASVSLVKASNDSVILTTTTDAKGYFSFSSDASFEYHILLGSASYVNQWYSPTGNTLYSYYTSTLSTTPGNALNITMSSTPVNNSPNSKVTINLLDTLGNKVAESGGSVYLISESNGNLTAFKSSATAGQYYADSLMPDKYALNIIKYPYPDQFFDPAGNTVYRQYFFTVSSNDTLSLDIILTDKPRGLGYITGKCLSETADPVPSLTISLYKTSDTLTPFYSGKTQPDGRFVFNEIIEQNYFLKITGETYPAQWYLPYRNSTGLYTEGSVVASIMPVDTLFISVTNTPLDNSPKAQMHVYLNDSNDALISLPSQIKLIEMQTRDSIEMSFDAVSSKYSATELSPGNYAVRVSIPGYPVQYYSPSGNLQSENFYKYVATDDSIVFIIKPVSIFSGTQTDTALNGYIQGIVKDSTGAPLSDVTVQILLNGSVIGNQTTNSAGSFNAIKVQANKSYSIFIPSYGSYPSQYWSGDSSTTLNGSIAYLSISANETKFADIVLRKSSQSAGIRQINTFVKNVNNVALKNIRIRIFPYSGNIQTFNPLNSYSQYTSLTDNLGYAVFNNIPSGDYFAYANSDSLNLIGQYFPQNDYFNSSVKFTVDSSVINLTFLLREGGRLNGAVKTNDNKGIVNAKIHANIIDKNTIYETTTDSLGAYTLQGLPSGTYTLSFGHNAYIVSSSSLSSNLFTVSEKNTTTVPAVTMTNGGFINGNFTANIPSFNASSANNCRTGGIIKLFSDSLSDANTAVKWMDYTADVNFSSYDSILHKGYFSSGICKTGKFRIIYSPKPVSCNTGTNVQSSGIIASSGWSFISDASAASSPVISINPTDTTKNLILNLRNGYSVFGKLMNEDGSLLTGTNYNIGVHYKIGSMYYCVTTSTRISDGIFELPGLVDGEEYYFEISSDGYPHQFWSGNDTNTTFINKPWKFSVADSTIPDIILKRNPVGDSGKSTSSFSAWVENTASGQRLIRWMVPDTIHADSFRVYSTDRTNSPSLIFSTLRTSGVNDYKFTDERSVTLPVYYAVVAKYNNSLLRLPVIYYNPSPAGAQIWINVFSGKHGIEINAAYSSTLNLTAMDSIFIYRKTSSESWKLFKKTSMYNTWLNDNSWNSQDIGKVIEYKAEIPSKNIYSSIKSITLDAAFFANLSKQIYVGPYEKFTTIQSAIDAAEQYSQITVKPGLYKENLNLKGKVLYISGSWDYRTPPVIDGNGGTAITIPFSGNTLSNDRTNISGFRIQNALSGINTADPVNINNCLFKSCNTAITNSTDTLKMSSAFISNPFIPGTIDIYTGNCTFIASKQGNIAFGVNSTSKQGSQNTLSYPVTSVNVNLGVKQSLFSYYYSRGGISTIPLKTTGNPQIHFSFCDFFESSPSSAISSITADNNLTLTPQFIDTVNYFLSDASALKTAADGKCIGYDSWLSEMQNNTADLEAITNITSKANGIKTILVSWDPIPQIKNLAFYKIYRLPADTSLFYINANSEWDIKLSDDSLSKVMDTFITVSTQLLDTTIEPGQAYIYAVAAVDSNRNESHIKMPSPPSLDNYTVNKMKYSMKIKANKWYMLSPWGTSDLNISSSANTAAYRWEDTAQSDNLYSHYLPATSLSAGQGYWFKSLTDTVLTVSKPDFTSLHKIEDTLSRHLLRGKTGWNIFGSPFPFSASPSWLSTIPVWEWNADSSGYVRASSIDPWKSYWIHIDRDTVIPLRTKDSFTKLSKKPSSATWEIQVSLSGENAYDPDNYCGIIKNALSKGTRMVEEPEPPQAFASSNLFFVKNHSENSSINTSDELSYYYQQFDKKVTWTVGISPSDKQSIVSFRGLAAIPENLHAFWIDNSRIINLKDSSLLVVAAHKTTAYGYIVVTSDMSQIALYSGQFNVKSPYPNPFRGNTVIDYVVPYEWLDNGLLLNNGKQLVTIDLYDILGRHCGQIFRQNANAGSHRFVWNGCKRDNRPVASGFYLLKIRCADRTKNLKIYKIK